jgi:hypothetical protein
MVHRAKQPVLTPQQIEQRAKDIALLQENSRLAGNALALHRLREQVRRTTSLVSTQGPVRERIGANWAADIDARTIIWRPTTGGPEIRPLDPDTILFLITHEASHLNYTGGYDTPADMNRATAARYHRLVNATEDIRIERLAEAEFGGFRALRIAENATMLKVHDERDMSGYAPLDQAWLAWHMIESGYPRVSKLSDKMEKFITDNWPTVNKAASAASTKDAAALILSIFRQLDAWKDDDSQTGDGEGGDQGDESGDEGEQGQGQGQGAAEPGQGSGQGQGQGDGDGEDDASGGGPEHRDSTGSSGAGSGDEGKPGKSDEGAGDDSLPASDRPARSEHDPNADNRPGSAGNIYGDGTQGMSDDAKDDKLKRDLADQMSRERDQQNTSRYEQAPNLNGTRPEWKDGSYTFGLVPYRTAATQMAPQIMMLSRRLGVVLANNAQEAFETGHRRGALHARKTYKVKMGNPRVFRKRQAIGEKNYVVGLAVDTSSSMKDQMNHVREMVVMLAESLNRAGIGMFMIPWATQPTGIWKTSDKLDDAAKGFLAGASRAHGGTYEAPALIMALDEFKKSPSATKIMITITDGDTISKFESYEVLADLKKLGVYDIGVEVGGAGNADQHAHRVRVRNVAELVIELPRILGALIRKGA